MRTQRPESLKNNVAIRTYKPDLTDCPKSNTLYLLGLPAYLGLEFEFESSKRSPHEWTNFLKKKGSNWLAKEDHSLRGEDAVEFVTKHPLTLDEIENAILEMVALSNEYKFSVSKRTGLHVHIDVADMTAPELRRMISLYSLIEPAIYHLVGNERGSNPFSCPWYKSQSVPSSISCYDLDNWGWVPASRGSLSKYSGLNLRTIYDIGTVEYRHMRSTRNLETIINWVNLILLIKSKSTSADFDAFFKDAVTHGKYEHIIKWLYSGSGIEDAAYKLIYPDLNEEIRELSQDIACEIFYPTSLFKIEPKKRKIVVPAGGAMPAVVDEAARAEGRAARWRRLGQTPVVREENATPLREAVAQMHAELDDILDDNPED